MNAQNNSSAPLKTAQGAYPALPAPDTHCHDEDTGQDVWSYSAEQMRAYAAQAVEAQAAPAAVAVPASWADIEDDRPTSRADLERVMDTWNDTTGALPKDSGWRCEVLGMLHDAYDLGAHQATPALPATEDSSAGDLAEVHPDDAAVDALAAKMKAKLAKQRAKGYGGWDTPECSQQRLSAMLRDHVAKGDPVDVANFCAFLAARSEGIEAEVQAEPVALQMCSELKPRTESEKAAYLAGVADGRMYAERDADTAPQAQPADALDAETIKKAARYDWIRQQGMLSDGSRHPHSWRCVALLADMGGERADEAIDAAMAAAQEGGNAAKEA